MVLGSDQPIRIKDRVMGWKVAWSWGEGLFRKPARRALSEEASLEQKPPGRSEEQAPVQPLPSPVLTPVAGPATTLHLVICRAARAGFKGQSCGSAARSTQEHTWGT